MSEPVLHYLHDPLCGWCYGAAPLLREARRRLAVRAHGGGMMAGPRRQPVTPALRQYVMQHDRRIARLTGQAFGERYFDGLLCDAQAVFDSEPPITAMLAAEELSGAGLDLLARMQSAHYVEGRRLADEQVLYELAAEIDLDRAAFEGAYARMRGSVTQVHIAQSRRLLDSLGGQGFPTFALEVNGRFEVLEVGAYFGQPQSWAAYLETRTGRAGHARRA